MSETVVEPVEITINMSETVVEPVEITITLKGSDQSFRKKYLEYNLISMTKSDPIIRELVKDAKKECKFEIEDIKIRASF